MVSNLLGNAIKFTPDRGAIRVSAEEEGAWMVLRVRDTGIGIPPSHLEHVFTLFAQTERSLDRSQGGLGIGLTVVRLLAELHGGAAEVFSAGDGQGTEAVIRLPAALSARHASPLLRAPVDGAAGRPQRVLIIEDNEDAADMLSTYLTLVGHEVTVAHQGHAGLEAALRQRPDVVICDIGLPGLDGYQVAARLLDAWGSQPCLLIALTGYGDHVDRERTRQAGFTHHLTKPADPARVANLIASVSEDA